MKTVDEIKLITAKVNEVRNVIGRETFTQSEFAILMSAENIPYAQLIAKLLHNYNVYEQVGTLKNGTVLKFNKNIIHGQSITKIFEEIYVKNNSARNLHKPEPKAQISKGQERSPEISNFEIFKELFKKNVEDRIVKHIIDLLNNE